MRSKEKESKDDKHATMIKRRKRKETGGKKTERKKGRK